jgi:hypothetical protein
MIPNEMNASPTELLEALRSGDPVNGDEGARILHSDYSDAINNAHNEVRRACARGPDRIRRAYWITGKPGNGKTQSLRQFRHRLPELKGSGKYAIASVEFDKEPAARRPQALAPSIVRHSLSGTVGSEVEHVRDRILRGSPADETMKKSVAFGIDVISGVVGIPSLSLFIGGPMRRIYSYVRGREGYIKRQLRKTWSSNTQLLELLTGWMRYVLEPTKAEREREFSSILTRLAANGDLFDLYCFALEEADYDVLILSLDEVDGVALDSLKPLWDRPERGGDRPYHELNLILVIAAKEGVREEGEGDDALHRRFYSTEGGHFELPGPPINYQSGNDAVDYVVEQVEALLSDAPYLRRGNSRGDGHLTSEHLRTTLPKEDITWHDLWQHAINKMVNLD